MPLLVPEEPDTDNFVDAVEPEDSVNMLSKDMPSPYARDAPKFTSQKLEELNRYIRRLEEFFTKYAIEDDLEKIRYLGTYADACTEKE